MSTESRARMLDTIDRALTLLDCAETIRATGGSVEIGGVRITPLDDRRTVLAEMTRDETADGVRADGFSKPGDDLAEAGRNDADVIRDADDGAGKGSTARSLPPLAGADASDVSVEGRSENGPQKGVQRLADEMREFAVGLAGGTWVPGHAARVAEGFADRAEAVEAERDRLAADLERTAEAADRAAVRLREVERERDEWKRRADTRFRAALDGGA